MLDPHMAEGVEYCKLPENNVASNESYQTCIVANLTVV